MSDTVIEVVVGQAVVGVTDGNKGDITVSGAGTAWDINAGAVEDTMIASVGWAKLTGVPDVLLGTTASFTTAQETKLAGIAAGANAYAHPNHSGDVTSVGDGATAIAANAVTNAKLADMATARIKGRTTAGTGDPEDLTPSQARAVMAVPASDPAGITGADAITNIVSLTSAEYAAIGSPSATTLYVITDA